MRDVTAREVMSEALVTVREDLDLAAVAAILAEREISGAPVVDAAGSLLGVVSQTDVARTLGAGQAAAGLTVRKIMTPMAETVSEDATLPEMARLMTAHHVHRLVVTRAEKAVGIVSAMDILRRVAEL